MKSICRLSFNKLFMPVCGLQKVCICWSVLCILNVAMSVGAHQNVTRGTIDIPEWTVHDKSGNICMRIAMDAEDSVSLAPIPKEATVSDSTYCEDEYYSYLELLWSCEEFTVCSIGIDFNVQQGNYTMTKIRLQTRTFGEIVTFSARLHQSPTAALGTSMSCYELDTDVLEFNQLKVQPFARRTKGNYGPDCGCNIINLPRTGLIVALVVIFVGVAFIAIMCYICPRYRFRRAYNPLVGKIGPRFPTDL
ncbi:hypothetical protein HOLleu_27417 [Holothuria leucospilota]|uniref:Uncharacterized protein n=1 Tax=Holothuria leucospilota TaxID=206669 RepID=A0A9Q1BQQ5_HOLLE|nr:hypothetical protein HOLleu_27417 [Holothuria leucospilota]